MRTVYLVQLKILKNLISLGALNALTWFSDLFN